MRLKMQEFDHQTGVAASEHGRRGNQTDQRNSIRSHPSAASGRTFHFYTLSITKDREVSFVSETGAKPLGMRWHV